MCERDTLAEIIFTVVFLYFAIEVSLRLKLLVSQSSETFRSLFATFAT